MSGFEIGLVGIGFLLLLTALGVHVGIAILLVGMVGLMATAGQHFTEVTITNLPFETSNQYSFIVVPMFVLMGALAAKAGIVREVYTAAYKWTSGIRGGLYIATCAASAGFSAISGSTVVNSAVFTRIALPEMIRFGYDRALGAGCIAAAGTFAALIPPSLSFVIYGILTGQSIGALLVAGILPGVMTAGVYIVLIPVLVRLKPQWAPVKSERFSLREKVASLNGLWSMAILMALVLGGIYGGFMPPSAAGAVGALGALVIGMAKLRLGPRVVHACLTETAVTSASLFLILIGGFVFGRFLVICGFIGELNGLLGASGMGPNEFVALVVITYLILGMFIDPISMLAMTIPIVAPLTDSLGLDPIWFAVIVVKLIEIAVITPPVGVNLFAVVAASEGRVTTAEVFRGVLPFVLIEFVVLAILIFFPAISTWLPSTMAR